MFELDHFFVWAAEGAPEADRLVAFGLTEGEPNTHSGQGTACRRFFFRNAYLEFVWVHDAEAAQSEAIRRAGLWQRWHGRTTGASPFGLALRPTQPGDTQLPFPAWEYRPPYLPASWAIQVGEGASEAEPWWFYLSFARRPDDTAQPRRQALDHPVGFGEITSVRLHGPGLGTPSALARMVTAAWAVSLADSVRPLAEITFDHGVQGRQKDFRPSLPLRFHW